MSWFSDRKAKSSSYLPFDRVAIEQYLDHYCLSSSDPLKSRLTQVELNEHSAKIHFYLYDHEVAQAQHIHNELAQYLSGYGIHTVNLHITQRKAPSANAQVKPNAVHSKPMPAFTDATVESNASNASPTYDPPIAKAATLQSQQKPHPQIQHVLAIASGKGGVGKSTTTVNLALALKQLGLRVGVLDADIYGPSIPTMLGNEGQMPLIESGQFVPLEAFGMPVLSIGHLIADSKTPVAWRGSKATGALLQLFNQTLWPKLDVLLIDMPPGTGDIQLTLAQRVKIDGAIIVTTPQHVALMDAQKAIELFNKVDIKTWGVIENMALHQCSHCGHEEHIFGTGGGEDLAQQYQIPLLGHLPLVASIRINADQGCPSVFAQDQASHYYLAIATKIRDQLALLESTQDSKRIF